MPGGPCGPDGGEKLLPVPFKVACSVDRREMLQITKQRNITKNLQDNRRKKQSRGNTEQAKCGGIGMGDKVNNAMRTLVMP